MLYTLRSGNRGTYKLNANVFLTDGSRAHKEKPDEMKLKPSLSQRFQNILPVGMRTLWAKTNFVPNDHHDGHEHRGICHHSLSPPYPRLLLFNDASLQFTAVCVCVLKAGRAAASERRPGCSRKLTGTSSVQERRTLNGGWLGRALHCVLSVAFASYPCVIAFLFCYPYRDSSFEPSN